MSLKLEDMIVVNLMDKLFEGNYNKPKAFDFDEAIYINLLKQEYEGFKATEDDKTTQDKNEKDKVEDKEKPSSCKSK